jgi:hypothetical protein
MSTPRPYASSDERDMQDTSLEELRRERDTQDTPVRSLETRNPTCQGGTPLGHAAAMGCSSRPGCSRASSSLIHRPCSTDEEREEERGRYGKREVVDWFFVRLCVLGTSTARGAYIYKVRVALSLEESKSLPNRVKIRIDPFWT